MIFIKYYNKFNELITYKITHNIFHCKINNLIYFIQVKY